jgi:hypothetical protein
MAGRGFSRGGRLQSSRSLEQAKREEKRKKKRKRKRKRKRTFVTGVGRHVADQQLGSCSPPTVTPTVTGAPPGRRRRTRLLRPGAPSRLRTAGSGAVVGLPVKRFGSNPTRAGQRPLCFGAAALRGGGAGAHGAAGAGRAFVWGRRANVGDARQGSVCCLGVWLLGCGC